MGIGPRLTAHGSRFTSHADPDRPSLLARRHRPHAPAGAERPHGRGHGGVADRAGLPRAARGKSLRREALRRGHAPLAREPGVDHALEVGHGPAAGVEGVRAGRHARSPRALEVGAPGQARGSSGHRVLGRLAPGALLGGAGSDRRGHRRRGRARRRSKPDPARAAEDRRHPPRPGRAVPARPGRPEGVGLPSDPSHSVRALPPRLGAHGEIVGRAQLRGAGDEAPPGDRRLPRHLVGTGGRAARRAARQAPPLLGEDPGARVSRARAGHGPRDALRRGRHGAGPPRRRGRRSLARDLRAGGVPAQRSGAQSPIPGGRVELRSGGVRRGGRPQGRRAGEKRRNHRGVKKLFLALSLFAPSLAAQEKQEPPPFLGEKLRFAMSILGVAGGDLTLSAVPAELSGKPVYKFEMGVVSNEFLSKFYLVRDSIVSWVEPGVFRSLRYEKHAVEGKRVRDELTEFDYEKGIALQDGKPTPLEDATLDTLSSVYYLRTLALDADKKPSLHV